MRTTLVAALFSLLTGCWGSASSGSGEFKKIHVADLEKLLAGQKPVHIFDANGPRVREKEGIIPNAVLLSSISEYDTGKVLPPDKTATLVFYCHNWL